MGMCRWEGYGFQSFKVLELTRLSINRTFFLARNAFSPQKRTNIAKGICCPILGEKTLIKQFKRERKMNEKPRKRLIQMSFEPGGYSWKFLVGVCRPVLQSLTLFQTKKCHFSQPFLDLASRIHTHFQTGPLRNYVIT